MAVSMFTAMMVMVFAFWMYTIAIVLLRVRSDILEREREAAWVMEEVRESK
jgi:heme exporter protein C